MDILLQRIRTESAPFPSEYIQNNLFAVEILQQWTGITNDGVRAGVDSLRACQWLLDSMVRHIRNVQSLDLDTWVDDVSKASVINRYYEDRIADVMAMITDLTHGLVTSPLGSSYSHRDHRSSTSGSYWDIPPRRGLRDLDAPGVGSTLGRLRQRDATPTTIGNVEAIGLRGDRLIRDVFGYGAFPGLWRYPPKRILRSHYLENIGRNTDQADASHPHNMILDIYEVPVRGRIRQRVRGLLNQYQLLVSLSLIETGETPENGRMCVNMLFNILRSFPCGDPRYALNEEFPHCREMVSHLWYAITSIRRFRCSTNVSVRPTKGEVYTPFQLLEYTYGNTQHWLRQPDFDANGGPTLWLYATKLLFWTIDPDGRKYAIDKGNGKTLLIEE